MGSAEQIAGNDARLRGSFSCSLHGFRAWQARTIVTARVSAQPLAGFVHLAYNECKRNDVERQKHMVS